VGRDLGRLFQRFKFIQLEKFSLKSQKRLGRMIKKEGGG
jgi:hypothetical protein